MGQKFIYLLIAAVVCNAGIQTRTSFIKSQNSSPDSNIVLNSGKIELAVRGNDIFKMFGDTLTSIPKSYYSDVIASLDTFTFFFADTVSKGIFKSTVFLTENGYLPVIQPARVCSLHAEKGLSLHADKGENGFLLSYVQKMTGMSFPTLHVNNGTNSKLIDSSKVTKFILSSQCYFEKDTFLVVNTKETDTIMLRKVYSRGNTVKVTDTKIVYTDNNSYLTTCEVAWDKQNIIVVTWISIDGISHDKYVHYKIFNRDLNEVASGDLPEKIGDKNIYYYDDICLFTYKSGVVASVFWDGSGIGMYTFRSTLGHIDISSRRLVSKSGLKGISAASNGKMLYVMSKGDINGDGFGAIEGFRYTIDNDSLIDKRVIPYNNPTDTSKLLPDYYSTGLNCAIDSNGSLGTTWKQDLKIKGSIWAYRNIRYAKGFWTSPVESLAIRSDDSIFFNPISVNVSSLKAWFLEDSIRTGNTIDQCSKASWRSFSNAAQLSQNHIDHKYYQYRIAINRKAGQDSIITPTINSVSISWNTKPKISAIDSVRIGKKVVINGILDTVGVLSRSDTLKIFFSGTDPDISDEIAIFGSWPAENEVKTVLSNPGFKSFCTFLPVKNSNTVISCSLFVKDKQNWYSDPFRFKISTSNALPEIKIILLKNAQKDTITTYDKFTNVLIQQTDSLGLFYSVKDINDSATVRGYIQQFRDNEYQIIDSTIQGNSKKLIFKGDSIESADTVHLSAEVVDVDTIIRVPIRFVVNHFPIIRECRFDTDIISNLDTVRVVLNRNSTIKLSVADTDCVYWDTLEYELKTKSSRKTFKSNKQTFQLTYIPDIHDTVVTITVTDKSGKSDSMKYFVKFPWFETDSTVFPEFVAAKEMLQKGSSLIIGKNASDSYNLPLKNGGNDTMTISGIKFSTNSSSWLSIKIENQKDPAILNSDSASLFKPLVLLPESTITLKCIMSSTQLHGDSVFYDTILLYTNDSYHTIERIPVKLEINDLPTIVKFEPEFDANIPFTGLGKTRVFRPYVFPPHSSIAIVFSEPMDSASAVSGIKLYSILDAKKRGIPQFLGLNYSWSLNYKKLNLRPVYKAPSPTFGIQPRENLFIPTDSLKLIISSALTDKAITPNGPNGLDVNQDAARDNMTDTSFNFKVDSILFCLSNISPAPGDTEIAVSPEIIFTFNTGIETSSVDTSLKNNSMMAVYSKYNKGRQLTFSSITIDSNTVKFKLANRLFYNDSIWCRYRSYSIRDYLGFPSDNDLNGISSVIFDSLSTADDVRWGYRVKTIHIVSIKPDSISGTVETYPVIELTFSDTLINGCIDTNLSEDNKSFEIRSLYNTKKINYNFIKILSDRVTVAIQPAASFYSNDTVKCQFNGFTSKFSYTNATNLPNDSTETICSKNWFFATNDIGFYTYPNPYKPGTDPRHCSDNGPCGIWFKNLHSLQKGIKSVKIRIFSMNMHPVFDSEQAGIAIEFETGNRLKFPQWLWNTRNNKRELVASGLYLYAIYTKDNHILKKGKLIIVR